MTADAAKMAEIGRLLRTQDNLATEAPIFIVQEQRRIYGFDPAYSDKTVWVDEEGNEADAAEHDRLEKLHEGLVGHDEGESVPGKWTRTAYQDEWHFVTACFTARGCNDYIIRNGHNHRGKLRVYAAGSYRNEEWRAVYRFLRGLGEADDLTHRRMPDLTIACNNQRPNEGATDNPDRVTCPDCIVAQAQIAEEKKP